MKSARAPVDVMPVADEGDDQDHSRDHEQPGCL